MMSDHANGLRLDEVSSFSGTDNKSFQDSKIMFPSVSLWAAIPVRCAFRIRCGYLAMVASAILAPNEKATMSTCVCTGVLMLCSL
mmetsp:Transcript_3262/g.6110  ORF Transcript_3262/g.6110 Transcript_3262/m.6110 type:complete len:85 (-) Transcript_3262:811-1065(-)